MNPVWNRFFIYSFLASIIIHVFALGGGAFVSISREDKDDKRTIITEIVTRQIRDRLKESDNEDKDPQIENKEQEKEPRQNKQSDSEEKKGRKTESGNKKARKNNKEPLAQEKNSHKKVLKVKEQDASVRKVLRAVKSRIDPLWDHSAPPAKGRVMLKLAIDTEGRAAVLNGPNLQNSELGVYIYKMVRRAAPFKAAMQHRDEPIQIECVFSVED